MPANHTPEFREHHGAQANARPETCETCHIRATCLDCHRPDATRQVTYHPAQFLTRHPSSAYTREANCSDCHNPSQFCQSCHKQSGLVATSRLGQAGYHDVYRNFSLGHGQAARQSLESCVACHAERDCTACHSAVNGGFRFSRLAPTTVVAGRLVSTWLLPAERLLHRRDLRALWHLANLRPL